MSSSVCQFAFPDPSFILRQSRVPSLLDTFGKCGCVYCETQSVVVVLFIFFGLEVLIHFLTVSELTRHSRFLILPNQPEGGSEEENAK